MKVRTWTLMSCLLFSAGAWGAQFGPRTEAEMSAPGAEAAPAANAGVAEGASPIVYTGPKFAVVIPVFDPGLPADTREYEKNGIWPELRRAEAVRGAVRLQEELQKKGVFASVAVMPDTTASADLYVLGEIAESNGEDYQLNIEIYDATGANWMRKKKFKHRVSEGWFRDPATAGLDPYSPIYPMISNVIIEQLVKEGKKHQRIEDRNEALRAKGKGNKAKMTDLQRVVATREVVFGRSVAPDLYGDAASFDKNGKAKLNYLPADDDPNWQRIEAVMVADGRFNELVSLNYREFAERMEQPYTVWQRDAYPLAREYREAKTRANTQAVLGVLGALAGAAAAASSNNGTTQAVGAAAAVAGAAAIATSFKTRAESKEQAAQLDELGQSVQSVVTPMRIEMQSRQIELKGTAAEQVAEWRSLLREIYNDTEMDPGAITVVQLNPPVTESSQPGSTATEVPGEGATAAPNIEPI